MSPGINIHVHVTPYQVQDDRRPWIRKEEKIFTDLLRRLGASITRHIHFESTTPNLVTHFEVLQAFCQHIHILQQQHLQLQQQRNSNDNEKWQPYNYSPVMGRSGLKRTSSHLQHQASSATSNFPSPSSSSPPSTVSVATNTSPSQNYLKIKRKKSNLFYTLCD